MRLLLLIVILLLVLLVNCKDEDEDRVFLHHIDNQMDLDKIKHLIPDNKGDNVDNFPELKGYERYEADVKLVEFFITYLQIDIDDINITLIDEKLDLWETKQDGFKSMFKHYYLKYMQRIKEYFEQENHSKEEL